MLFKKFTSSVLNFKTLKTNILDKKVFIFSVLEKGSTKLQKLLQFKRLKISFNSTKTRQKVRGGGKKPRQQKGTGKARSGSLRSPLYRGGGTIFGPKFKLRFKKLNKTELNLLFQTLIYNIRFNILIIKEFQPIISNFLKITNQITTLIILETIKNFDVMLKLRNLKNYQIILLPHVKINHFFNKKRIILTATTFDLLLKKGITY